MRADEAYEMIRAERIIAIVRGVSDEKIIDVAEALLAGGVRMVEITCNTKGVLKMIARVSREMAGRMVVGAGTVVTKELCIDVLAAGAKYIIAPDVNSEVIKYCIGRDVAVLPGAATATEILTAKRLGARMVKIFPAGALGTDYIRMLRGPIDDVEFVAVGGVRPTNLGEFMRAGCMAIGIGGSVVRKGFLERCDWESVSKAAAEYVRQIKCVNMEETDTRGGN